MIEELQRTIFERQGVAGPWGIQCLGRVNAHYKTNVELLSEFYSFVSKCGNIHIPPLRCAVHKQGPGSGRRSKAQRCNLIALFDIERIMGLLTAVN